jgi:hypothetical protein
MDDDSDVFHSLENSDHTAASVSHSLVDSRDVCSESPLKKQRVGSPDKGKEVMSPQVDSVEVKELIMSQHITSTKEQNSCNDQETGAADAVEVRLDTESVVQKREKNAISVDNAEADVERLEEAAAIAVAGGKHLNVQKFDSKCNVSHVTHTSVFILMALIRTLFLGSSVPSHQDKGSDCLPPPPDLWVLVSCTFPSTILTCLSPGGTCFRI